jgi:predicted TIM-barrel fold metal-dependent hydrolase
MSKAVTEGETHSVAEPDPLGGLKIIDCDAHFTEPPDLWTSRAPLSMREKVPVLRTIDGFTGWHLNGELWAGCGGNTIELGREKVRGLFTLQPFDRVDPSSWLPEERLKLMDEMGIHAQVIYPNGIGFTSNHIFAIDDPKQRIAILRMYNDFLVDVQEMSNERLFPQAILPIWDMQLTIDEMERLLAKDIRGFTLSDRPELLGLPELPEPYFDPMWDLFSASSAVANFHIGSGNRREDRAASMEARRRLQRGEKLSQASTPPAVAPKAWSSHGVQRRVSVEAAQNYVSNIRIIVNLCMSNLFDRFPNLKIVSAESGIGWVPFLMEALEYQFDEMVVGSNEVSATERRPSEYFKDHLYVMFWFEKHAPSTFLEAVGINNVLVETDVPHPTCLFPKPRDHFAKVLVNVSPHARQRILQDNAAELYRIPLS